MKTRQKSKENLLPSLSANDDLSLSISHPTETIINHEMMNEQGNEFISKENIELQQQQQQQLPYKQPKKRLKQQQTPEKQQQQSILNNPSIKNRKLNTKLKIEKYQSHQSPQPGLSKSSESNQNLEKKIKNPLHVLKKKMLKIKKSNVSKYITDIVQNIIKSEIFKTITTKT